MTLANKAAMNIFVYIELIEKISKLNSEKWNPETGAHFKFDGYGKIELPKGCNNLHLVCLFFFSLTFANAVSTLSAFFIVSNPVG